MSNIIIDEYKELLAKKLRIEQDINYLPQGYISKKNIKGKEYHYLQNRVNGKIKSKYIKKSDFDTVLTKIELAKKYKSELPQIEERLIELEQAAKLIDKNISRKLMLLKLSFGMDSLDDIQKEHSIAFANSMNAIEGISASKETEKRILSWKNGEDSFIEVMKSTLDMYGFSTEV